MCKCLDVEIVLVSLQNRKASLKHSELAGSGLRCGEREPGHMGP